MKKNIILLINLLLAVNSYAQTPHMNGTKYRTITTSDKVYNIKIEKLPAGIYYIMIQQGDQRTIKKIVQ